VALMGERLSIENTFLVIIDIQGNLAQVMIDKLLLFENVQRLIKGMRLFAIPIVVTEQTPQKLGTTTPEIQSLLAGFEKLSKTSFSCCKNQPFMNKLSSLKRNQVLLAGIEAHICVYQTAIDLIQCGYEVHIIGDAVSSRTMQNREIGIQKMRDGGAALTSTETILFELLQTAEHVRFKEISKIVK
jgi:nicotinamidase-related amidase